MALLASACSGEGRPEPSGLLDQAFSRPSLVDREGKVGPTTVEVASLGYRDRILEAREVPVSAATHRQILEALASGPASEGAAIGLVSLAGGLETGDPTEVSGVPVWPVTGVIGKEGLLEALDEGERSGVAGDLGVGGGASLRETLRDVGFTAWVSVGGERLERLDLVVELDDPGNSLPPSRLRFRLE